MKTAQFGTLIGSYGKGIAGAVTVNFTQSGGDHCDDSCPLKGNVCYAELTAKLKLSIAINLQRKESDFSGYLRALTTEKALSKLASAPWVRFCAFGTVPHPDTWTIQDRMALRLIANAVESHGLYHFPTETTEKADALRKVGFSKVRVSVGQSTEALLQGKPVSVSFDCGKRAIGKNKRAISQPAMEYAKELRHFGLNAKVCPAIAGKAKCGLCTMCADNDVAMIVYPIH